MRKILLFCFVYFVASWNISAQNVVDVYTDKSMYNPGDEVKVTIELQNTTSMNYNNARVRMQVSHLNESESSIKDVILSLSGGAKRQLSLTWKAPDKDFQGYLIEVSLLDGQTELDKKTCGVNVSSTWVKFPIYGYVHDFNSSAWVDNQMEKMCRYHINGIEFYDWHHRHHMPIPKTCTSENLGYWDDWAGRIIDGNKVKEYIDKAHARNMASMAYDMVYAGTESLFSEKPEAHNWQLKHRYDWGDAKAGDVFKSVMGGSPSGNGTLFFMNTLNKDWQNHLFAEVSRALSTMGFDGYHGDTFGDWGDMTDVNGNPLGKIDGQDVYSVARTYKDFLDACKDALPQGKYLSFNPVGAKGIQYANASKVDVLYTEFWVWDQSRRGLTYDNYYAIAKEVDDSRNDSKSVSIDGKGKSLAVKAYINYGRESATLNDPTVLLFEAAMFAHGGTRMELGAGERMLSHEYYPNDRNLPQSEKLKNHTKRMYDFLVAYENLLRDGQESATNRVEINNFSYSQCGESDKIWTEARADDKYEILHLINLLGTNNEWRDQEMTKKEPTKANNIKVKFYTNRDIKTIYIASPDDNCSSKQLSFSKGADAKGDYLSFVVPQLEYWDMIYMTTENAPAVQTPEMKEFVVEAEDFSVYTEYGQVSSNNKYISGLINNPATYKLSRVNAGKYKIITRYVSPYVGDLEIVVDGKSIKKTWTPSSDSWDWYWGKLLDCGEINVNENSTIEIKANGAIQVDYLRFVRLGELDGVIQAEDFSGYSESGIIFGENRYVSGINENEITYIFPNNFVAGCYKVDARYVSGTDASNLKLSVDGREKNIQWTKNTESWSWDDASFLSCGKFQLAPNTVLKVKAEGSAPYIQLDYFRLEKMPDFGGIVQAENFSGYTSSGIVEGDNRYVTELNSAEISYTFDEEISAGKYNVKVRYLSAISGQKLQLNVNDNVHEVEWTKNTESWNWVDGTMLDCGLIDLESGTILKVKAEGNAPYIQLDYFSFEKQKEFTGIIQAEDFSGYTEYSEIEEENYYVSGVNENEISYTLGYEVPVGVYKIAMRYVSGVSGQTLHLIVGDEVRDISWEKNSESWSWNDATMLNCGTFSLMPGMTIKVRAEGNSPYIQIDYFSLTEGSETTELKQEFSTKKPIVFAEGDCIVVTSVVPNTICELYNIYGHCVATEVASCDYIKMTTDSGVYVLRVGEYAVKVMVQ